ncbi:hypothetical protein niasHS_007039 [Heterodera schachtii]|uniref:Uncharacterized protein n=1 Tax=Heterodera schachtii TaxID=97005 RepID=A0ABD2JFM8_HETSC
MAHQPQQEDKKFYEAQCKGAANEILNTIFNLLPDHLRRTALESLYNSLAENANGSCGLPNFKHLGQLGLRTEDVITRSISRSTAVRR